MDALADTFLRAVDDDIVGYAEPVILYDDGRHLHGSVECQGIVRQHTLPAHHAVMEHHRHRCDCRGVLSTGLGRILQTAEKAYAAIDDDQAGARENTWAGIDRRLRALTDRPRSGTGERIAFTDLLDRGDDAGERIAKRSAVGLGVGPLLEALAAQALEVTVTAEEANSLGVWARHRRIAADREGKVPPDGHRRFEEVLAQTMRNDPYVVVALPVSLAGSLIRDYTALPELRLLLWSSGRTGKPVQRLDVPRVAARGLTRLLPDRHRRLIGVHDDLTVSDDTLEAALTLWSDPGNTFADFTEAADAAERL